MRHPKHHFTDLADVKFNLLLLLSMIFAALQEMHGQQFTFLPFAEYSDVLEMDVYSEHQITVGHDLADSAYISWRVIEEEYPEGWDVQLCDWQHCYTWLPNTGDMLAVAEGATGYVRLLVNPMGIPGNAHFLFWIFPTGEMSEHADIVFDLETIITGTDHALKPAPYAFVKAGQLHLHNGCEGALRIYSSTGMLQDQYKVTSTAASFDASGYAAGIYIAVTADGRSLAFTVE